MSKTIKIYLAYFAQFLMGRLTYRFDFFMSIIANMLVTASGLIFVYLLIDGKTVPALKGWSRDEVLFIYGYSMISMSFFSALAPNLYSFGDRYIIQGQFDRVLLRPLNSLCQVIFESFNLDAIGSFLVGLTVLVLTKGNLRIEFGFGDYLWLVLSSLSGGIILLAVFILLASFSFHFEDRMGISPPFYNMITFGRYPIPIFNSTLQFILKWVVPFAFVAFYPATHFLSRPGFEFFCYLTPVMAFMCLGIASGLWQFGVSRYSSAGN